jgi:hypothetical protein
MNFNEIKRDRNIFIKIYSHILDKIEAETIQVLEKSRKNYDVETPYFFDGEFSYAGELPKIYFNKLSIKSLICIYVEQDCNSYAN